MGYLSGSEALFHMSCHGLLEQGHPSIVFASQFAAQLVFYQLGEVARFRQLAWFQGAANHAHPQGATEYWFENLAHQSMADGGNQTFRLAGELYPCSCCNIAVAYFTAKLQYTKQMPVLLHCHLLTSS